MRSNTIKSGFDRAPHRSLLKATGVIKSDDDFKKPFIGIANSYIDLIPGHVYLQEFGKFVKDSVLRTLAIAHGAGIDFAPEGLNELARRAPYIRIVSPASKEVHMEDVDRGGAHATIMDRQVIRSAADPYSAAGSLAILCANLGPNGSAVKVGAIDKKTRNHSGPDLRIPGGGGWGADGRTE